MNRVIRGCYLFLLYFSPTTNAGSFLFRRNLLYDNISQHISTQSEMCSQIKHPVSSRQRRNFQTSKEHQSLTHYSLFLKFSYRILANESPKTHYLQLVLPINSQSWVKAHRGRSQVSSLHLNPDEGKWLIFLNFKLKHVANEGFLHPNPCSCLCGGLKFNVLHLSLPLGSSALWVTQSSHSDVSSIFQILSEATAT